jgi:uncharacterized protein YndB with AHSA1/START domain
MTNIIFIAEPGKPEVVLHSHFEAPREVVFKALSDPNLIPQWWGPRIYTTIVDKMEVRPGGQWRFVQRDPSGNEYGFHGVYHDVSRPERIVMTFEYEGFPGKVLMETMTLEEKDGITHLTDQSVFQSLADRDGMVASGMESGSTEGMQRLAELLGKVRNA